MASWDASCRCYRANLVAVDEKVNVVDTRIPEVFPAVPCPTQPARTLLYAFQYCIVEGTRNLANILIPPNSWRRV